MCCNSLWCFSQRENQHSFSFDGSDQRLQRVNSLFCTYFLKVSRNFFRIFYASVLSFDWLWWAPQKPIPNIQRYLYVIGTSLRAVSVWEELHSLVCPYYESSFPSVSVVRTYHNCCFGILHIRRVHTLPYVWERSNIVKKSPHRIPYENDPILFTFFYLARIWRSRWSFLSLDDLIYSVQCICEFS
jgi:hypothetical protein